MAPVLEEALRLGDRQGVERAAIVRAQARKQRHVVGADEDVHTVDLEKAQPADLAAHGGGTDRRRTATRIEALSHQRDTARLQIGKFGDQIQSPERGRNVAGLRSDAKRGRALAPIARW
ncbi:hypothetical protein ACU4GA_30350 [Methylobacterium oryzae CBMB20]